jgi:hypothetical protein
MATAVVQPTTGIENGAADETEVPNATPTGSATEISPDESPAVEDDVPLRIVYFLPEDGLYLWARGDDRGRQIVEAADIGDMRMSRDGRYLAYTIPLDFSAAELWVIDLESLETRLLLDEAALRALAPDAFALYFSQLAWVPGQDALAFGLAETFEEGPGSVIHGQLRVLDLEDRTNRLLVDHGDGAYFVYSPDGRWITASTPTTVHLYRASGELERADLLTFGFVATYSEYAFVPTPLWSPDSSYFLVNIPSSNSLDESPEPARLWRISAEFGADLVAEYWPWYLFGLMEAQFISPDFSQLVYTREVGEPADPERELVLRDLESGAERVIAVGNYQFSGWSPDSEWLIWDEYGENERLHLHNRMTGEGEQSESRILSFQWVDDVWAIFDERVGDTWQLQLVAFSGEVVELSTSAGRPHRYVFAGR